MRKQCMKVVKGSMFVHDKPDSNPGVVCEECYHNHYYGREEYTKAYKHCILAETITPEMSRKICNCVALRQDENDGNPKSLFPIDNPDQHEGTGTAGREKCKLLRIGDTIAIAKYHGLLNSVGAKPRTLKETEKAALKAKASEKGTGMPRKRYSAANPRHGDSDFEEEEELRQTPEAQGNNRRLSAFKTVQQITSHGADVSAAGEAAGDKDIPLFFRGYTEKYPYANVPMALRVGPLIIENGVSQ